jgi:hypothetical protein
MTYAARPSEFIDCAGCQPAARQPATPAPRRGFWRRVYDAVLESHERRAEREIGAYLASTGGRFTDAIERRVSDRLLSGEWRR